MKRRSFLFVYVVVSISTFLDACDLFPYRQRARFLNLRIGSISHVIYPGLGWCYRCKTNWAFVESHTTWLNDHAATFPLCEQCWDELTPEERLPYYRMQWEAWPIHQYTWDEMRAAVMRGE